ncbi:MAG: hypothetical protein ACI4PK_00710 [Oscillospiraceae bacterium]
MSQLNNLNTYNLYFAKTTCNKPYSSNDEYIKDISALMDMYVEIA